MNKLDLGMSNFDQTVDEGFEDALKKDANKVCGQHSAWNFCGTVFFDGKQFCEQVSVHHVLREIIKDKTLNGLMEKVNNKYGWD